MSYTSHMDHHTQSLLEELGGVLIKNDNNTWIRTGSSVVDHTKASDYDFVILETDKNTPIFKWIEKTGFLNDGSPSRPVSEDSPFHSYSLYDLNIIYVTDKKVFDKYVAATYILEDKKPKTKEERIAVFDAIFDHQYTDMFYDIIDKSEPRAAPF